MKELHAQLINDRLIPTAEEDIEALKAFKPHQILRLQVYGISKMRSYQQLKLWFACCRTVADNTEDVDWNTSEKVSEQVKLAIQHVEFSFKVDGVMHMKTKSISYKEMSHLEMTGKMDEALGVMAAKIGLTIEELTNNCE